LRDDQGRLPSEQRRVDAVRTPSSVDSSSHERDHFLIATEYYVNQATVPVGVALFACSCGATHVECDLHGGTAPEGWWVAADGSARCPRCAGSDESSERQT
jgi:hypothetical protein